MDFRINGHAMTTGTISHGTLKAEDLIRAFAKEMSRLVLRTPNILREANAWIYAFDNKDAHTYLRDYDVNVGEGASPMETVEAMGPSIANDLQSHLSEMAPENIYFGTLEGDGSDFGWWESEEFKVLEE